VRGLRSIARTPILVSLLALAAPVAVAVAAAVAVGSSARPAGAGAGPHEYGCPILPASNAINRDISRAPVDPRSVAYIASIGPSLHLHADFGANPGYGIPCAVWEAGSGAVFSLRSNALRPEGSSAMA
jgi:hypothetical protein